MQKWKSAKCIKNRPESRRFSPCFLQCSWGRKATPHLYRHNCKLLTADLNQWGIIVMPTISLYKKHARSISSFNPVRVNDFNSKIQKASLCNNFLSPLQCKRTLSMPRNLKSEKECFADSKLRKTGEVWYCLLIALICSTILVRNARFVLPTYSKGQEHKIMYITCCFTCDQLVNFIHFTRLWMCKWIAF